MIDRIAGTVSKQITIICDKSPCSIEKGCLLIMYNTCLNDFFEKIVRPLLTQYSLNCGYVSIRGVLTICLDNLTVVIPDKLVNLQITVS